MTRAAADDRGPIRQIEAPERYVGYVVCDPLGRKIGSVEKIFVNENHQPEYVRVKMGLFGLKSVLIPTKSVAIDEERRNLMLK
ncbi:MAG: hypothetical protein LC781_04425 [Actinobacteria bacterium]|nr:hypothetical protein [Actinomycetota bacterium]